jgi:diacylglycerol kinase family enzyme
MIATSRADMSDGKLDVCIFKHKDIRSLFGYYLGMRNKDVDRYISVQYLQCHRIEVLRSGRQAVHVDAEYLCKTPVTFEVCPRALRVAA